MIEAITAICNTNLERDNKDERDSYDARKLSEITCIESSGANLCSIRQNHARKAPNIAKMQSNGKVSDKVDDGRVEGAEEKAVSKL